MTDTDSGYSERKLCFANDFRFFLSLIGNTPNGKPMVVAFGGFPINIWTQFLFIIYTYCTISTLSETKSLVFALFRVFFQIIIFAFYNSCQIKFDSMFAKLFDK